MCETLWLTVIITMFKPTSSNCNDISLFATIPTCIGKLARCMMVIL